MLTTMHITATALLALWATAACVVAAPVDAQQAANAPLAKRDFFSTLFGDSQDDAATSRWPPAV
ncbi:MAG: hypothetical protein M1826_001454 [Phylliscum demangeonii]|nr:MAG: hypothetical protein M1826_001454 [Phylliscum demangeonii]